MANEYFDGSVNRVAKGGLIKSQHINDLRDAISVAFDKCPSQTSLLTGTGTYGTDTGVANTYAIQAGRELRVIVESSVISDEEAILLSKDIQKRIEESLTFPGQIKITVIRETRAVEYANK